MVSDTSRRLALLASFVLLCSCAEQRRVERLSAPSPTASPASAYDPTAEEPGDREVCDRWENDQKNLGPDAEFQRPEGDYEPGLKGRPVDPREYLPPQEIAKLAATALVVLPRWLPDELLGRPARVHVFEPYPAVVELLYSVSWPGSHEGGFSGPEVVLRIMLSRWSGATPPPPAPTPTRFPELPTPFARPQPAPSPSPDDFRPPTAPPASSTTPPSGSPRVTPRSAAVGWPAQTRSPLQGNIAIRGRPGSLPIGQVVDHDRVVFDFGDDQRVEVESRSWDFRVNCRELLAIARSIEPYRA